MFIFFLFLLYGSVMLVYFFFSSRRRHTRWTGDWSSDVCSSDLDDLDFLLAGRLKDDVELVLLLDLRLAAAGSGRGGRSDRDRRGGLDVERLLELLHELRELEEGHLLERVEQVVATELRHGAEILFLVPSFLIALGAMPRERWHCRPRSRFHHQPRLPHPRRHHRRLPRQRTRRHPRRRRHPRPPTRRHPRRPA